MSVAVISGSAGLIGSEAARYFGELGLDIVGIDNDMRRVFFGEEASTAWNVKRLQTDLGQRYQHHNLDIRDRDAVLNLFQKYGSAVSLVIHTAAQPSHDWAAKEPLPILISMRGAPLISWKQPANFAQKHHLFLPRLIKSMAIPPIDCH
jgi:CDP-paratose 2-epimerase